MPFEGTYWVERKVGLGRRVSQTLGQIVEGGKKDSHGMLLHLILYIVDKQKPSHKTNNRS